MCTVCVCVCWHVGMCVWQKARAELAKTREAEARQAAELLAMENKDVADRLAAAAGRDAKSLSADVEVLCGLVCVCVCVWFGGGLEEEVC